MRRFLLTASLTALLATPAFAQDVSDLLVRLNRLESQVRQLSGQNEQLQFENKRLSEQLAKFQKDVEFRFQDLQPGAKPGAAPANAKPASPPPPAAAGQKRSDAFDPAAQPGAPGAPQSLGVADIIAKDTQTAPSQPLDLNAMRPGGSVAQAAPQTTSSIIPSAACSTCSTSTPASSSAGRSSRRTRARAPERAGAHMRRREPAPVRARS